MLKENILTKMLAFIIIAISSFGIIINIIHFIEIRKKEVINFNKFDQLNNLKETLARTEQIISKIDLDNYNGEFNIEKLNTLNNNINSCFNDLSNSKIMEYKGEVNVTVKHIYNILKDYDANFGPSIATALRYIEEYDPTMKGLSNLLMPQILISMVSMDPIMQRAMANYNYFIIDKQIPLNIGFRMDLFIIASSFNAQASQLEYIANWLLNETGGSINE